MEGGNIHCMKMAAAGQRDFDARNLWRAVRGWPRPTDYWNGRRISSGLAPDNILIFPKDARDGSSSAGYGHYHPRYVLDVALDCVMNLHIAGREFRVHSGECALIFPHQFHDGWATAKKSGGWIAITFDLANPGRIGCLRDMPRRLGRAEKALLLRLLRSYREQRDALETAHHLSRLLLALARAPHIPKTRRSLPADDPERSAFLQSVHQYLEKPAHASIVSGMAEALGLKKAALHRQFQRHTGISLAEYVRQWRMGYARKMLETRQGNITEISSRLGFSSIPAFSRAFKAAHGLPPKQYESTLRKNRG